MARRARILLALVVLLCSGQAARAQEGCTLSVGVVPQFEQRKIFEVWSNILEKLESRTGCHFELKGSENINLFEKAFQDGFYDLAYVNPYHAVMAKKAQGYEPVVRSDASKLEGILVVRKDSPIVSVAELAGKEVAMPSPNALGASLLIRADLDRKGKIAVKPFYVKTHSSVYLHVVKGLSVAGGGVAATLSEQPDAIRNELRILYKTEKFNGHPLIVHPRVSAQVRERVRKAWLELAAEQPELFDGVPMKQPVASNYADYEPLDALGLESYVFKE